MSADNPPRRRVRLVLEVEADTWHDVHVMAYRYLDDLVERGRDTVRGRRVDHDAPGILFGSRGSPSGRASYVLNVDPAAPVGDEYHERLRQWADEVRTQSKEEEGA